MAKTQNPFGGAPRLGNTAPGEPADLPSSANPMSSYGGAPEMAGQINRGHKAVNPNGGSELFPAPYGGAPNLEKRPNQKSVKGGGANVGAGTTTGTQVP